MSVDIFEVEVGPPVHGGACLARDPDGKPIFVRGAIPGEVVKIRLTAKHKKFAWAETVEVVRPSPWRTDQIWPEAATAGVGGADLAHVLPEYQRQWKSDVLADQLRRIGGQELYDSVAALGGDSLRVRATPGDAGRDDLLLGRRTRVQLTAGSDGRLGMHRYRSREVVPLATVPIADPGIESLRLDDVDAWRGTWRPGERVEVSMPPGQPATVSTRKGVFTAPRRKLEGGRNLWSVEAAGQKAVFPVSGGGFWQAHRQAPQVLVQAVLRAADPKPGQTILELYSGAGLLTKFLASRVAPGGQVLSLEGSGRALADAALALGPEIDSGTVTLFEGKIDATAVADLAAAAPHEPSTVVLDPPRKGAGGDVMAAIAATSATTVVLISCDVAAGARDLKDITAAGFSVKNVEAWDLFPHTHHFELVTTLTRDS